MRGFQEVLGVVTQGGSKVLGQALWSNSQKVGSLEPEMALSYIITFHVSIHQWMLLGWWP
jgi:hypothetical protein